ncbi:MAG: SIMPL domain-containing protein, partial [Acidimicrobiia bacterium]
MGDSRLVAVGVVATALLLGGCATQGASAASTDAVGRTITGTATGKVEGVPDTLTVTLGVESQAPSAQAALAQNADRSTRVIASLKASGVAPKDLQTTQLSLNPTFDQRGRITGYAVSNLVTAKVHDVVNAGKVVDAAAAQAG